jgi:hypothetical protein
MARHMRALAALEMDPVPDHEPCGGLLGDCSCNQERTTKYCPPSLLQVARTFCFTVF